MNFKSKKKRQSEDDLVHVLHCLHGNSEGNDNKQAWKRSSEKGSKKLLQDGIRAFEYYKRAADLRNSCAHNNLGLCFGMARGVDRDFEEAFKYYKKAADCYDKGTGVEIECTELPKKDADRLS